MSKPIPLELPARDLQAELYSRLERAPREHAEALLAGYEVLQGLHDAGVLDALRGVLGSGEKVLKTGVEAARSPGSTRLLRNLLIVLKTLAEIDPELFDGLALAFPEAMVEAKRQGETPPGILAILNEFRGADLRRGLVAVNSMLRAWGKKLSLEARSSSKE